MKKFKKFLATVLVASMLLTTNAASVFAEGISAGTEEQLNEETFETTEELSELEEETRRGERLSEPEEDIDENLSEPEEEAEEEETTVGAKFGEPEVDVEEEVTLENEEESSDSNSGSANVNPSDETETESVSETEILQPTSKLQDELFGAGDTKFIIVGKNADGDVVAFSTDDTDDADTWAAKWAAFGFDENNVRGFYWINTSATYTESQAIANYDPDNYSDINVENMNAYRAQWKEHTSSTSTSAYGYCYGKGPAMSMTVIEGPTKTTYDLGDKFDPSGLKFKVKYQDDSEEEVAYVDDPTKFSFDPSLDSSLSATDTKVTVSMGLFASVDINITMNPSFMYFRVDATESERQKIYFKKEAADGYDPVSYDGYGHIDYPGFYNERRVVQVYFEDNIVAPKNLSRLFYDFQKLEYIYGLDKLNTSNTENMESMFEDCSGIEQLNLYSLDTRNVTNMTKMFKGCSSVETIIVSDKFDTSKVTESDDILTDLYSLIGGDGEDYGNASDLTIDDAVIGTPYPNYKNGVFSNPPTLIPGMYWYLENIGDSNVALHFTNDPTDHTQVGTLDYGVYYYDYLRTVVRDYDLIKVVFDDDVKNITGVTTTEGMFRYFHKLENIEGLDNFDTSAVTNMHRMFEECWSLETIDNFTSLSTDNVTSMSHMFLLCKKLKSIDFSNFNTSKVTNMSHLLAECENLESVTFGDNFDTSSVTDMLCMFSQCLNLTDLDVSMFNTSRVTDMSGMFQQCKKLTSIDLFNFDTRNVVEMSGMFGMNDSLTEIDISSFDTSNVEIMSQMFAVNPELVSIYASDKFVTNKISEYDGSELFLDCPKLVGGNGTTFDPSKISKEYARLDGGPDSDTPGYFGPSPYKVVYNNTATEGWKNKEWYTNGSSADPAATPIIIAGSSNNYKYKGSNVAVLYSWNTRADGTGATYNFGQSVSDKSKFTNRVLDLYPVFKGLGELSVKTPPTKSEYYVGEKFDPTGLILDATLNDNSHVDISWDSILDEHKSFDPTTIADDTKNVIMTFNDFDCHVPITLKPPFMYWKFDDSNQKLYLNNNKEDDSYKAIEIATDDTTDIQYLNYNGLNKEAVKTVIFENEITPPTCANFFYAFDHMTSITDLDKLDTSNATSMYQMFASCPGLESLDLRTFNTKKVTDMTSMFANSDSVVRIYVSGDFEVSQVTSSDNMFYLCQHLQGDAGTVYDVNRIDKNYAHIDGGTANPGYFSNPPYMYWRKEGYDTIYYSSTNDPGCRPIEFDADGIKYTGGVVNKEEITTAKFANNITATSVKGLFNGFTSLATISDIAYLDTSNVLDFSYMFNGCVSLTELDLQSLDTSNATNMTSMFADDEALEIIRVSDKFVVDKVTESEKMFNGCIKIEGERGTLYDSDKIDIEYAHLDGGTANPGYLSGAPARSTLDTSGTPKLYVVAYDGTDATKKIYSVNKTAGESALANILDNLNLPDPTASVTGYYVINGAAKDSDGHRVFLNEDDLKDRYGEAKLFDPGNDKTRGQLLSEYQDYADTTEVYDLYFGVCYSPFIREITAVDGISLDKFDELAYFEENTPLKIDTATITVKYTDGNERDIKYTDDPDNFSVEPAVFKLGDSSVAIKYKTLSYTITDNMYVWQKSDGWNNDVYKIESVEGYRKVYVEGEKFDPTNLKVYTKYFFKTPGTTLTLQYLDKHKSHWKIEDKVLSLIDTSVKIQVGGYSGATFDVPIEVVRKGLSATIDSLGQKNYYIDGDYIGNNDRNGLTVTITYSSDPTPVSYTYPTDKDYFTFNPSFNDKVTTNDEKISMIVAGMKLDYPIVVLPDDTPTAAVREKDPDKTQYVAVIDNHFDPNGLKIKLTYPGGITKIVEYTSETFSRFTCDPDISASLDPSIKNIKVSFDGSPVVEFPITVRKEIKNISYVSGPDNNIYSVGDKFDPTGLVIKITYVDDEEEQIPYNSTTASGFSFDPELDHIFDDSDIGNKVLVTFGRYTTLVPIDNMEILGEGFSFISADNITGAISLLPNIPNKDDLVRILDAFTSEGAIGFHIISANGINDAKKKYNKYTASTLTKDAVLAEFDNYAGGFVFVGASFKSPTPTPKPSNNTPTYSDSGSDGSSGGGGPAISGNNNINIYTVNNIPLSSMLYNPALYLQLMSYPENTYMQKTNAKDVYGNTGFGRWLRVPNTTTWYFYAGDFNNNTNNSGFLKDGWFNLGWDGVDRWYRFDSNGVMQLGWYEENGKIYFLQNDFNDNWYGKAVTGTHVIDGKTYTFDSTGALIQ